MSEEDKKEISFAEFVHWFYSVYAKLPESNELRPFKFPLKDKENQ